MFFTIVSLYIIHIQINYNFICILFISGKKHFGLQTFILTLHLISRMFLLVKLCKLVDFPSFKLFSKFNSKQIFRGTKKLFYLLLHLSHMKIFIIKQNLL